MICTELAWGGFICGEEMREVRRECDGDERWCFVERKQAAFDLVVTAPTDSDLFPGRVREWDE